jgi:hypothetical protein
VAGIYKSNNPGRKSGVYKFLRLNRELGEGVMGGVLIPSLLSALPSLPLGVAFRGSTIAPKVFLAAVA